MSLGSFYGEDVTIQYVKRGDIFSDNSVTVAEVINPELGVGSLGQGHIVVGGGVDEVLLVTSHHGTVQQTELNLRNHLFH